MSRSPVWVWDFATNLTLTMPPHGYSYGLQQSGVVVIERSRMRGQNSLASASVSCSIRTHRCVQLQRRQNYSGQPGERSNARQRAAHRSCPVGDRERDQQRRPRGVPIRQPGRDREARRPSSSRSRCGCPRRAIRASPTGVATHSAGTRGRPPGVGVRSRGIPDTSLRCSRSPGRPPRRTVRGNESDPDPAKDARPGPHGWRPGR